MFGASKFNSLLKHPGYNDPISAALGIGGALIGKSASDKSAKAATSAANTSAAAQLEAARIAAEESRPRYLDFQDPFGKVNWTLDANGRPTAVGVSSSDFTKGLIGNANSIYKNYYGLLNNYFQPNVEAGGSKIYNEWQNLLTPTRQTQQSQLFDALQAKGITGIEGYDPRTGAGVNPYAQSLFGAWGAQDAQMASQAINEYLNRLTNLQAGTSTARGDLVGTAQLPYQNTLSTSANLASRAANPAGASLLAQGLTGAANTQAQGAVASAAYKNNFWNSFGNNAMGSLQNLFTPATQSPAPVSAGVPTWSSPYSGMSQDQINTMTDPYWTVF